MSKVIVIGAGPAGIMAAIHASKEHEVILLDGNEKLGRKLFITGKGRCNVTNARIYQNSLIIYQVILISYIVHYIVLLMRVL